MATRASGNVANSRTVSGRLTDNCSGHWPVNRVAAKKQAIAGEPSSVDDALRDPCVLEFLHLEDECSESGREEALIRALEHFLLELGNDFTFVAPSRGAATGIAGVEGQRATLGKIRNIFQ